MSWSECANVQADLCLRCPNLSENMFLTAWPIKCLTTSYCVKEGTGFLLILNKIILRVMATLSREETLFISNYFVFILEMFY